MSWNDFKRPVRWLQDLMQIQSFNCQRVSKVGGIGACTHLTVYSFITSIILYSSLILFYIVLYHVLYIIFYHHQFFKKDMVFRRFCPKWPSGLEAGHLFFSSVDLRMGQKHMDIHDFAGDSCARPNVIGWMLKGTICKKLW